MKGERRLHNYNQYKSQLKQESSGSALQKTFTTDGLLLTLNLHVVMLQLKCDHT